jgi:hypothetical protein
MKTTLSKKALQLTTLALLFLLLGSGLELYLINHYHDIEQAIPLIALTIVLLLFVGSVLTSHKYLFKLFHYFLYVCIAVGVYGTYLHLVNNLEFEQELRPTAALSYQLWQSLSGATPVLAPLSFIVLSIIGFIYITLKNHEHETHT